MLHNTIQSWLELNKDYINFNSKSIYMLFMAFLTVDSFYESYCNRSEYHIKC
jgi:hypothetical protein